jgi:hypothetical protein
MAARTGPIAPPIILIVVNADDDVKPVYCLGVKKSTTCYITAMQQ